MKKPIPFFQALRLHLRGLGALHQIQPRFFPAQACQSVFRAVTPYVTVFLAAQMLRELALQRREEILWFWIAVNLVCLTALSFLSSLWKRRTDTLLKDLWGRKELLFIRKGFSMSYSVLDHQETQDLRSQIKQNENWSEWGFMKIPFIQSELLSSVIGLLSGFLLTAGLFFTPVPETSPSLQFLNHPVFLLLFWILMIGISYLSGFLSSKASQCWSDSKEEATIGNRLFGHFGFVGEQKERCIDVRLQEQENLVSAYWKKNHVFSTDGIMGKLARGKMGLFFGFSACISTLTIGAVYLFVCLKSYGGAFDVGSITQYVGAATAMIGSIGSFTRMAGLIITNAEYLENTFRYLDLPNTCDQGELPLQLPGSQFHKLVFHNVSFRYPGAEQWSVQSLNLELQFGQTLALVGENGSGKTTLVKLICRLYDPQEGEIFLDGVNIQDYRLEEYLQLFSVVFQDFELLSQPLGANIACTANYTEERVRQALLQAGFTKRLDEFPQGTQTMLYKNLSQDGVELSAGEAQKIAIARALYRNAPLLILDEPTASLDPLAEAEIYEQLHTMTAGKTALYISHRLSSCRFCDEIVVLSQGQVIQQGTHETLLADQKGQYYALWTAQAQYYQEASLLEAETVV